MVIRSPNSRWEKRAQLSLIVFFLLAASHFHQALARDFPNYFLESNDSKDSTPTRTSPHILALEKAAKSVFDRLKLPYVDANGRLQNDTRFLSLLQEKIHKIDPDSKVYLSGGVMRSVLGYIYKKIDQAKQRDPKITTSQALAMITQEKQELSSLEALGIGSDFDVLIQPSRKEHSKFKEMKSVALSFINSAQSGADLGDFKGQGKASIMPIGDVNDYEKQTQSAFEQGGSTLDLLAFDLKSGVILNPSQKGDVLERFTQGYYDYLAPGQADCRSSLESKGASDSKAGLDSHSAGSNSIATVSKASDKQTIRGLRPLLEIPFLRVSPPCEPQLEQELNDLTKMIVNKGNLTTEAYKQIEKMFRNAHFGGADNRFHHSQNVIETTVRVLAAAIEKEHAKAILPEFVRWVDTAHRKVVPIDPNDKSDRPDSKFLMTYEAFRNSEYSDQGVVYHGTPMENYLSIIRNGLILSKTTTSKDAFGRSTAAACGRGAYATGTRTTASGFADKGANGGCIFSFTVSKDARILEWEVAKKIPGIQELLKTMSKDQVIEHLAKENGIDIVIDQHVLVQNSAVLNLPKDAADLIRMEAAFIEEDRTKIPIMQHEKADAKTVDASAANLVSYRESYLDPVLERLRHYYGLYRFGTQLGLRDLPDPLHLATSWLLRQDSKLKGHSVSDILKKGIGSKVLTSQVAAASIAGLLHIMDPGPENEWESVLAQISHSPEAVQHSAILGLKYMRGPKLEKTIIGLLKSTSPTVHNDVADALRFIENPSSDFFFFMLVDQKKSPKINEEIARLLLKFTPRNPSEKNSLLEFYRRLSYYPDPSVCSAVLYSTVEHPDLDGSFHDEMFSNCLKSKDPISQTAAIRCLGRYKGSNALSFYQSALQRPSRDILDHFVIGLREMTQDSPLYPQFSKILEIVLQDSTFLSHDLSLEPNLADSLEYLLERYPTTFSSFLNAKKPIYRRSAARLLDGQYTGNSDEFEKLMLTVFNDPSKEVTRAVCDSMDIYRHRMIAIKMGLRSTQRDVNRCAADSLRTYQGEQARELLQLALNHSDEDVRGYAVNAVESSADPRMSIETALESKFPEVVKMGVRVAVRSKETIQLAMNHPNPEVRKAIFSKYVHLFMDKETGRTFLDEPSSEVSNLMLDAGLESKFPDVRLAATEKLGFLKGPQAKMMIDRAFNHSDAEVRLKASELFEKENYGRNPIRNAGWQQNLSIAVDQALESKHPEVSLSAIPRLDEVAKSPDDLKARLEKLLNDPRTEIREGALLKLIQLFDSPKLSDLTWMMKLITHNSNIEVQWVANDKLKQARRRHRQLYDQFYSSLNTGDENALYEAQQRFADPTFVDTVFQQNAAPILVRWAIVEVRNKEGPRVLSYLKNAFEHSASSVRATAVRNLGYYKGGDLKQWFKAALQDHHKDVRDAAVETYFRGMEVLEFPEFFNSPFADVRSFALEKTCYFTKEPSLCSKLLNQGLADRSPEVRETAARLTIRIANGNGSSDLPALFEKYLSSEDPSLRRAAEESSEFMGKTFLMNLLRMSPPAQNPKLAGLLRNSTLLNPWPDLKDQVKVVCESLESLNQGAGRITQPTSGNSCQESTALPIKSQSHPNNSGIERKGN